LLDYDYLITRTEGAEHAPLHFLSGFLFSGDSGALYQGLAHPIWVAHGVRGQPRSDQVDDRMAGYGSVLLRLIDLLTRTRTRRRNCTATDYLWVSDP
jgi:hypothetical protein